MGNSVEAMKAERKQKKRQFNTYAKRRNGLTKIIGKIDNELADNVTRINRNWSGCLNNLSVGLRIEGGSGRFGRVVNDTIHESQPETDKYISDGRTNLSRERSRCQTRINELDDEIRRLESRIKEAGGIIMPWE